VWNTDEANGLRLIHTHGRSWLEGSKIFASGAGHIERPLVTATDENGLRLMVLPNLGAGNRTDLGAWPAHGMRASATGAVDFTGVEVQPLEIVGCEGDYERQPWFSAGAWRFAAVQLGGMERLFDLLRRHLQETNRGQDPHQAARLGEAAIAVETARLWVTQVATIAEDPLQSRAPEQLVAYVNLARLRWSRRLSTSCSLCSAQSGSRLSCARTRSSAYRVTLQLIFANRIPIACGQTRRHGHLRSP
jgi:alkylation response protein AidB-like acyl-CoA dehydrogenase